MCEDWEGDWDECVSARDDESFELELGDCIDGSCRRGETIPKKDLQLLAQLTSIDQILVGANENA